MPNCKLSDKGNCIIHEGKNVEGCMFNEDTGRCKKAKEPAIEQPQEVIIPKKTKKPAKEEAEEVFIPRKTKKPAKEAEEPKEPPKEEPEEVIIPKKPAKEEPEAPKKTIKRKRKVSDGSIDEEKTANKLHKFFKLRKGYLNYMRRIHENEVDNPNYQYTIGSVKSNYPIVFSESPGVFTLQLINPDNNEVVYQQTINHIPSPNMKHLESAYQRKINDLRQITLPDILHKYKDDSPEIANEKAKHDITQVRNDIASLEAKASQLREAISSMTTYPARYAELVKLNKPYHTFLDYETALINHIRQTGEFNVADIRVAYHKPANELIEITEGMVFNIGGRPAVLIDIDMEDDKFSLSSLESSTAFTKVVLNKEQLLELKPINSYLSSITDMKEYVSISNLQDDTSFLDNSNADTQIQVQVNNYGGEYEYLASPPVKYLAKVKLGLPMEKKIKEEKKEREPTTILEPDLPSYLQSVVSKEELKSDINALEMNLFTSEVGGDEGKAELGIYYGEIPPKMKSVFRLPIRDIMGDLNGYGVWRHMLSPSYIWTRKGTRDVFPFIVRGMGFASPNHFICYDIATRNGFIAEASKFLYNSGAPIAKQAITSVAQGLRNNIALSADLILGEIDKTVISPDYFMMQIARHIQFKLLRDVLVATENQFLFTRIAHLGFGDPEKYTVDVVLMAIRWMLRKFGSIEVAIKDLSSMFTELTGMKIDKVVAQLRADRDNATDIFNKLRRAGIKEEEKVEVAEAIELAIEPYTAEVADVAYEAEVAEVPEVPEIPTLAEVAEVPYVADEVPYEEPEQLPNPIDMVDDAGEYSQITFKVYETIVDEQSIRVIIEYRPEDDVVSPIGIISSTGHIRYLTEGDPFNDKVFQISADYLETLTPSLLKRLPSVIYYRDMTDNTVYFKQGNDMVKIGKWTSKELDGDGYIDTTI